MEVDEHGRWQPPKYAPKRNHVAYFCVLWTLHLRGPFEHKGGQAVRLLRAALVDHGEPYVASPRQPDLSQVLTTLGKHGVIERVVQQSTKCTRLACLLTPEQMPANPYSVTAPVEPSSNGHRDVQQLTIALDPLDALAAIGGLVDEALGHGLNAAQYATADALARALAEKEELRVERDQLQAALLEKLRQIEVLQRALASARRGARVS